eukprot:TRINITY_DN72047_c0_g1_i1.p1 TRINITY_DN72047_c0_g1~~TRINITY_DN72047_c0_g1_i1.p1  ORF type:complete len:164 (-),score=14.47 TRINITY_DN72047_c0_g1_i1:257-748(-)
MFGYKHTMSVRNVAKQQCQRLVDTAASGSTRNLSVPPEGWIATVRKALGISGAQLGRMTGRSRATVAGGERSERDRVVTLHTMDVMAKAMGCRFVYAIIPETGSLAELVEAQARKKAEALVYEASRHMALESQAIGPKRQAEQIEQIARDLVREAPADFWEPE